MDNATSIPKTGASDHEPTSAIVKVKNSLLKRKRIAKEEVKPKGRNTLLHGWRTVALFVFEQLVILLTASYKLNVSAESAGHRFFEFSHEFLNFTRL